MTFQGIFCTKFYYSPCQATVVDAFQSFSLKWPIKTISHKTHGVLVADGY